MTSHYESCDPSGCYRIEEIWTAVDPSDLPGDLASGDVCDLFVGGATPREVVEHNLRFVGGMLVEVIVIDVRIESQIIAHGMLLPDVAAGLISAAAAADLAAGLNLAAGAAHPFRPSHLTDKQLADKRAAEKRAAEKRAVENQSADAQFAEKQCMIAAAIQSSAAFADVNAISLSEILRGFARHAPMALEGKNVPISVCIALNLVAHRLQDSDSYLCVVNMLRHVMRALDVRKLPLADGTEWFVVAIAALLYGSGQPSPSHEIGGGGLTDTDILAAMGAPPAVAERTLALVVEAASAATATSEWAQYLRHAGRLESRGWGGLAMCFGLAQKSGVPLWTPATPRAETAAGLDKIVCAAVHAAAPAAGAPPSVSAVDCIYQCLMRTDDLPPVANAYLTAEFAARMSVMTDVCREFGKTGAISRDVWDRAMQSRYT